MRTYQLGTGTPRVAVVGAVHGDEPCGVKAVEGLVESAPAVERPVKLIVANEEALERGVRFVDADLNRVFDEPLPGEDHEHRLARRLAAEIRGCVTLSLHSTHSYPDPVAAVNGLEGEAARVAAHLPIDALLDIENDLEGRLFELEATPLIEVESGYQGSEAAAENAREVTGAFLRATGVLPGEVEPDRPPVYRMGAPIHKPAADSYEVCVDNFEQVERGQTFARAGDRRLVADEPFSPVLLSADGYDDIFGYVGEHVGPLEVPESETGAGPGPGATAD